MTDLYDFPTDHIGRKSFVTVHGHGRSVPKFKTYLGNDRRYHLLPEYGGNWDALGNSSTFILPDKLEYVSPIDRQVVTSRSGHREHMKRHSVYEAGDMKLGSMAGVERSPLPRAGHDIVRAIQELSR